ncbi:MAG: NlpC/P60 family protein [Bacteroidales bacterium]
MQHGICLISVAPLRLSANDNSEMVSQVLFGEIMEIIETKPKWLYVRLLHDNYLGWISQGQVTSLSHDDFLNLDKAAKWVNTDLVQVLENKSENASFLISGGSTFYDCEGGSFNLLGDEYLYHGNMNPIKEFDRDLLVNSAMMFLHCPYLWGGKSALGIDCSGLTQVVYKIAGKSILRDASQQATQGEMINLIHEALPGDLLFFDNEEEIINHVGILLDSEHILHAHQKVRIDKIDHQGIFNTDIKKYSHKLRLIKRM